MPGPKLWLINSDGKVYTLHTNSRRLHHVSGREFKKLSAVSQCVWALGSDHQLYVYVPSSDIPLRVQESTYENERWTPGVGWTGKTVVPNARLNWSDVHGRGFFPKENFILPSPNWEWEGEWQVDETMGEEVGGLGGWQYAINFLGNFSAEMTWKTYVRKRKWVRYRRYVCCDSWAQVPVLESVKGFHLEPFLNISVGGQGLPSQVEGQLCVWAISISGQVYVREGVCLDSPEGHTWRHISTGCLGDTGVIEVSVGKTGQVWLVTWDGQALVRIGVSCETPYGTGWVEVPGPASCPILQVSVGRESVWALSREGKIWFWKPKDNSEVTQGNWIEMVGDMAVLSVSSNDQVFGIGLNDTLVHMRTAVSPELLTGKTWQPLTILEPSKHDFSSSMESGVSVSSSLLPSSQSYMSSASLVTRQKSYNSLPSLDPHEKQSNAGLYSNVNGLSDERGDISDESKSRVCDNQNKEKCSQSHSDADNCNSIAGVQTIKHSDGQKNSNPLTKMEGEKPMLSLLKDRSVEFDSLTSTSSECVDFVTDLLPEHEKDEIYRPQDKSFDDETCNFVTDLIGEGKESVVPPNKMESSNTNGITQMELIGKDNVTDLKQSGEAAEFFPEDKEMAISSPGAHFKSSVQENCEEAKDLEQSSSLVEFNMNWIWVSSTACDVVDTSTLPWLQSNTDVSMQDEPPIDIHLRHTILSKLLLRNHLAQKFSHYEEAVEKTVWVKRAQLQLKLEVKRESVWVNCLLELEQGLHRHTSQDGLLFLHFAQNGKQMHSQIALTDIVCVCRVTDESLKSAFAIYLPKTVESKTKPYILAAASEKETDDWVASIAMASSSMRGHGHTIDSAAVWAVTERGDVFVHQQTSESQTLADMHWVQVGGHMLMVKTNTAGITWAISHDHTAYVYSGGYGGGIFKGISGASKDVYAQTDVRQMCIYENQKWHLLKGFSPSYLLANKYAWTDETGKIPLRKEAIQPPSNSWQWIDDWTVDFTVHGGVDIDGWQYVSSSPRTMVEFHGEKGWWDSYRRRKWVKCCKLVTSGPWIPVGPLPIIDVSIQQSGSDSQTGSLWAVGANGDALCRIGVTTQNPPGSGWLHVPADKPFLAISIGGNTCNWVWAVARGGSVWFRSGVTPDNPTGKVWLQVVPPPPGGVPLQQITVGENSVWAVDANKTLWRRKDTTAIFPEGTEWVLVSKNIQDVCAGPGDQVWAIRDNVPIRKSQLNGVISRRRGISAENYLGTDWEDGVGGVWKQVCAGGAILNAADNGNLSRTCLV